MSEHLRPGRSPKYFPHVTLPPPPPVHLHSDSMRQARYPHFRKEETGSQPVFMSIPSRQGDSRYFPLPRPAGGSRSFFTIHKHSYEPPVFAAPDREEPCLLSPSRAPTAVVGVLYAPCTLIPPQRDELGTAILLIFSGKETESQ